MSRIRAALLLCLVWGSGNAWGATYYVSYNSGNDASAGTSSGAAWKYHPWDANATGTSSATVLQAGDIVYLKKGEVWYSNYWTANDSGANGNPIVTTTLDGFGVGDNPIVTGAWDQTALSFTDTGSNIYTATITTQPRIVVWNGTVLANSGTTTPASNQWYWSANTFYVNVGANPSTGTLRVGRRDYCVLSTGNDISFSNITFEVANTAAGGTFYANGSARLTIYNCVLRFCPNYIFRGDNNVSLVLNNNILTSDTSNSNDVIHIANSTVALSIYNNTIGSSSGRLIYTLGAVGTNIYNNVLTGGQGISLDNTDSASIHDNTISNSSTSGSYNAIYLSSSDLAVVYRNTISGYWNGLAYGSGSGGRGGYIYGSSENNKFYQNTISGCSEGITINTSTGSGGNSIYNNLFINQKVNTINIISSPSGATHEKVIGNTIFHRPNPSNSPAYSGHGIAVQTSGKKVEIANNLVYVESVGASVNPSNTHGIKISGAYEEILIDYNLVFVYNYGYPYNIETTSYSTLADFRTAANSIASIKNLSSVSGAASAHDNTSDPAIFDATANNARLRPSSPARAAGTNLCGTLTTATDMAGRTVCRGGSYVGKGAAPSIGAYEYWPTGGPHRFLALGMNP